MRKRWKTALYAAAMAMLLTACAATEDEIQRVEQEDITPQTRPEKTEAEGEEPNASEQVQQPEEEGGEALEEGGIFETVSNSPVQVSIETDKKEYKDGDRILLITNYDDVTVSFEGNEAASQAVMAEFARRKEEFEERLELEETLEMARENPVVDGSVSYSEENWYTVERNDGRVLSFSAMWDSYEGGAHGQYMIYGVNFDGTTGKVLTIDDVAQDRAAFQEICVQEMLRQCEDLKARGVLFDEEMLSAEGLQEILEGKMEGAEWYFTENEIRFISNVYEIAPYAAGSIDFDISYEMVNEVLKEAYRG